MIGHMVESWSLRDKFAQRLNVIQAEHPTAKDTGASQCCRSGVCCWRRPGALDQSDVANIADAFGATPRKLFSEYLVVDEINGILCLLPRRKHQSGGEFIHWKETFSIESPCVFLADGNACEVHEVKPIVCREYRCWEEQTGGNAHMPEWTREELIALGWDGRRADDEYDDWYDDETD